MLKNVRVVVTYCVWKDFLIAWENDYTMLRKKRKQYLKTAFKITEYDLNCTEKIGSKKKKERNKNDPGCSGGKVLENFLFLILFVLSQMIATHISVTFINRKRNPQIFKHQKWNI